MAADLTLEADTPEDACGPPSVTLCVAENPDSDDAATCGVMQNMSSFFRASSSAPAEAVESEEDVHVKIGPAIGAPDGDGEAEPSRDAPHRSTMPLERTRSYAGEHLTGSETPHSICAASTTSRPALQAERHAARAERLARAARARRGAMSAYSTRKLYPHWFTNRGKRFMYPVGAVVGLAIALLGERFWARACGCQRASCSAARSRCCSRSRRSWTSSRASKTCPRRAPKKGGAAGARARTARTST